MGRADAIVLRLALMVRAVDEDVPLLLTIFDPDDGADVARELPNTACHVAGGHRRAVARRPLHRRALHGRRASSGDRAVGLVEDEAECARRRSRTIASAARRRSMRALFTPYDKSAGLLLFGAIGLVAVFVVETSPRSSCSTSRWSTRSTARRRRSSPSTPTRRSRTGPDWYKLFTSASMLIALVFAAAFTAGLVNRVIDRRLTGLFGRRAVPRRDHVVVVGLGQVGLRLCLLLRALRGPRGGGRAATRRPRTWAWRASSGLPVVIGRGADPSLMRRLSLQRARAVAA